jgi:hypothetical protein
MRSDGYMSRQCKECIKNKAKVRVSKIDRSLVTKPSRCTECERGPPEVEFPWHKGNGGWSKQCKECRAASDRARKLKNPDKVKENKKKQTELERTDPDRKLKVIEDSARKRGIAFPSDDPMKLDAMRAMLSEDCHYSGHKVESGGVLNGLDRVDSSVGYDVMANLVPCSGACNMLKGSLHVSTFITHIRAIAKHLGLDINAAQMGRTVTVPVTVTVKDKTNELTAEQEKALKFSSCTYCGRSPAFGIDKIDSDIGYTPGNSCACCSNCNYMKNKLTVEEFERQVCLIARHTAFWVMPDMSHVLHTFRGKTRHPVTVTSDGIDVIFPSVRCAATILNVTLTVIRRDLSDGFMWSYATAHEYHSQHLSPGIAQSVTRVYLECIADRDSHQV